MFPFPPLSWSGLNACHTPTGAQEGLAGNKWQRLNYKIRPPTHPPTHLFYQLKPPANGCPMEETLLVQIFLWGCIKTLERMFLMLVHL